MSARRKRTQMPSPALSLTLDQKLSQLVSGKTYNVHMKYGKGLQVAKYIETTEFVPAPGFPGIIVYVFEVNGDRMEIDKDKITDIIPWPIYIKEIPQDISRELTEYLPAKQSRARTQDVLQLYTFGGRRRAKSRRYKRTKSRRSSIRRSSRRSRH